MAYLLLDSGWMLKKLTVIGVFFRGPGWEFIAPWTHSYVEM